MTTPPPVARDLPIPADRWVRYFEGHGALGDAWLAGAISHWSFSERLHGYIARFVPPKGRILDVGCGPGSSVLWLGANGYEAVGVDREPSLVASARKRAESLGVPACFEVGDASDLSQFHGRFDLCLSVGVLEHFDRSETVALLREQGRCAGRVLIAIPTKFSRYTNEVTDERFYSVRELAGLVSEAGMTPVTRFGYGEIAATSWHRLLHLGLPRAILRLLQDRGYAYTIAVVGQTARHN